MPAPRKRATKKNVTADASSARAAAAAPATESALLGVARQVRSWSDSVLGIAGAAADVSIGAAKAIPDQREQRGALQKPARCCGGMREAAGLSLSEVGEAINLEGSRAAGAGRERQGRPAVRKIILRLRSVLGATTRFRS
ncbi:MAG: hypothetical protein IPF60_15010 [Betaproteobacteria bacterium]|nr:hypothetical protein [Betaproteobacteria bacterium]